MKKAVFIGVLIFMILYIRHGNRVVGFDLDTKKFETVSGEYNGAGKYLRALGKKAILWPSGSQKAVDNSTIFGFCDYYDFLYTISPVPVTLSKTNVGHHGPGIAIDADAVYLSDDSTNGIEAVTHDPPHWTLYSSNLSNRYRWSPMSLGIDDDFLYGSSKAKDGFGGAYELIKINKWDLSINKYVNISTYYPINWYGDVHVDGGKVYALCLDGSWLGHDILRVWDTDLNYLGTYDYGWTTDWYSTMLTGNRTFLIVYHGDIIVGPYVEFIRKSDMTSVKKLYIPYGNSFYSFVATDKYIYAYGWLGSWTYFLKFNINNMALINWEWLPSPIYVYGMTIWPNPIL
jgi:hypothetical protein